MTKQIAVDEMNGAGADRRRFIQKAAMATAAGAAVVLVSNVPVKAEGVGGVETRRTFRDIQRHENAHVAFLLSALGSSARPKPTFQNLLQSNLQAFFLVSQALENTGVGAYLGAAPYIFSPEYLAAAGSIGFIEARHAGWLNSLVDVPITTNVFGQDRCSGCPAGLAFRGESEQWPTIDLLDHSIGGE
jgi:hypothetical protein